MKLQCGNYENIYRYINLYSALKTQEEYASSQMNKQNIQGNRDEMGIAGRIGQEEMKLIVQGRKAKKGAVVELS